MFSDVFGLHCYIGIPYTLLNLKQLESSDPSTVAENHFPAAF